MWAPHGLPTVVICGLVRCQHRTHCCVQVSLWYDTSGVTASCALCHLRDTQTRLGGEGGEGGVKALGHLNTLEAEGTSTALFILSVYTAGPHPIPLLENGVDMLCTSPISVCLLSML